jgi:hypothetical protein
VNFIVVLEPSRQQSDYGLSIRQDRQPSIIAFKGFDMPPRCRWIVASGLA